MLVELDGVRLVTDPLLRRRVVHLRRAAGVDPSALGPVDAVLVSHLHFDHLDFPSLERLGRDVRVVVPRGAGRLLARRGFSGACELGRGETLDVGALSITATPAVHARGRLPLGARVEPIGYLISGSRSVYFAGDTDVFPGMAELGPVDVALLPIWGWGPALGPGHMGPRAAAEAARLLRAAIVIPIHWGTYFPGYVGLRAPPAFVEAPAAEFVARMRETAPEIEVRVLRPGGASVL